jgi:hypothetical protein
MPTIPCPPLDAVAFDAVGFVTVISTSRGPKQTATVARPEPCRAALVNASFRMR